LLSHGRPHDKRRLTLLSAYRTGSYIHCPRSRRKVRTTLALSSGNGSPSNAGVGDRKGRRSRFRGCRQGRKSAWTYQRTTSSLLILHAPRQSGQEPPLRAYADQVGIDLSHVDLSHVKLTPELISLLMNNPLTRSHMEPERLRHIA
jgi:hypothetical protein